MTVVKALELAAWVVFLVGITTMLTLGGLGVAETFWGDGGRRGPWFMAVLGVIMTAMAPGAIRRTSRGLATGRHD